MTTSSPNRGDTQQSGVVDFTAAPITVPALHVSDSDKEGGTDTDTPNIARTVLKHRKNI